MAPIASLRRRIAALRSLALRLAYERRSSVDTNEIVDLSNFGLDHPERHRYQPSGWRALRRGLSGVEISPGDVFLDVGSGTGRIVAQAARLPFARVIGIEISPELVARAERYVGEQRGKLRAPVELIATDATTWQIPDEVTHVYLNNPFSGSLFQAVVDNLVASLDRAPRPLAVIYLNPLEREMLLETGRFVPVNEVRRGRPGNADDLLVLRATTPGAP